MYTTVPSVPSVPQKDASNYGTDGTDGTLPYTRSKNNFESAVSTTRIKANTIGFYAIRGNNTHDFLENSRAESIANFLGKIKEENNEYKGILVIMDNFGSHVSAEVRKRAEELGIIIVYLPLYSPDLDPLEFFWKSIKRVISTSFIKSLENLKDIIQQKYKEFSQRLSYATSWINRFLKKNGLCSKLYS